MSVASLGYFPSDDVLSPLAEFMLADVKKMDTAFFLETS
jgi:hypothetical protein